MFAADNVAPTHFVLRVEEGGVTLWEGPRAAISKWRGGPYRPRGDNGWSHRPAGRFWP